MTTGHETLGDNVVPVNYKLVFVPDLKTFKTKVFEDITCRVKRPTRTIVINAKEIEFEGASVFANGRVQEAKISIDKKSSRASFSFRQSVSGEIQLAMTSVCENNDRMYGFYRSKYTDHGKERHILTTQFEAPNARAAFPCFDEPSFKATFDVSFIIDRRLDAISNMPIKETSNLDKGRKIVRFEKSAKMSTYLLYLFVGNYESIGTNLGKLKLRAITVPGQIEYVKTSLEYAKKFLDWQQRYFGIDFPLPKLDFIGIPDFAAGAMENWGAITFREIAFAITRESSAAIRQQASETISHEITHQWFGDLVTMKWWNDLWLNESFATFLGCKAVDEVFPEWDFEVQYVDEAIGAALAADALKSTHPISVHINSPDQIDSIFDAISYEKGGSVLYMLEDYVGKETFRKGLHRYLSRHAYSNATKEDLWNAIQEEARKSGKKLKVSKLMTSWVTKAGHPVVDVKRAKGGFLLSQKRFTLLGDMSDFWPIPIHYMTGDGEGMLLMEKREQLIRTDSPYIKLNYGQKGVYRVKYEGRILEHLGKLIREKKLAALDAWGIENDLFSFARSGRLPVTDYLDFVEKYCFGLSYPLSSNISGHLGWFFNMTYGTRLEDAVKKVFVDFNKDQLRILGWAARKGEREIDTMLRGGVIANLGIAEDAQTVKRAKRLFDEYRKSGRGIDPNIRGAIFSTVAWNFGPGNFRFFFERYKKEKFPEEQRRLLGALSAFKDKGAIVRSLKIAYSRDVRLQDSMIIPIRMSANLAGRDLYWPWIKKNWKQLVKRYDSGTHMLSRFPEGLSFMHDKKAREGIVSFFAKKGNMREDIRRSLNQTLERIDANIKFFEKNKI
ncbi:MAG: M1 family metallopeptidase [Candidatus Micrarchaeota archaeon]|nr:M1 family metallopeptidase [Candidatus Micrarchaeota archaeon]